MKILKSILTAITIFVFSYSYSQRNGAKEHKPGHIQYAGSEIEIENPLKKQEKVKLIKVKYKFADSTGGLNDAYFDPSQMEFNTKISNQCLVIVDQIRKYNNSNKFKEFINEGHVTLRNNFISHLVMKQEFTNKNEEFDIILDINKKYNGNTLHNIKKRGKPLKPTNLLYYDSLMLNESTSNKIDIYFNIISDQFHPQSTTGYDYNHEFMVTEIKIDTSNIKILYSPIKVK